MGPRRCAPTFSRRKCTTTRPAGVDPVAYYLLKLDLMRFQMPKMIGLGSREKALPSVIVAWDRGTRAVKFVRMQGRAGKYVMTHFGSHKLGGVGGTVQPTQEHLIETLRDCMSKMNMKRGHAVASMSARSTVIRHVDFPQMPLEEMKKSLKINSAPYLHQQYTGYNFDCYIMPPRAAKTSEAAKAPSKLPVLVGGASTQDVLLCRDSLLSANLTPLAINLAPVAVINAFESSNPDMWQQDTVALVDIGHDNSVISVIDHGRPSLTRSIQFGGSHITAHIAKTLSLDEKAAEEEKLKMSEAIQVLVGSCLSTFARQIRSSIDFFERQNEVPVKRVFCSAGAALSSVILQFLTDEIGLPCKSWDSTAKFEVSLKNQKQELLKEQAPDLAVSVGTALAVI